MENYEGNEKEFKQYNEILKKDFEGITFYYDNNIKKYFGNVVNNLYEGRGILYNESGDIVYDGFFKKGKYEGFGKLYDEKLLKYEGFFLKDEYEGKGNLYYNDSNKIYFEGIFKEGKIVKGKLYDLGGNPVYQGSFKEERPIKGNKIKFYDINKNLIYHGDFKDGKYHGFGEIYKRNILYYRGNFENDEIKGKGIKYYTNGNKHIEGYFEIKNLLSEFNVYNFKENYAKGILYDYNGNYILETEFHDFIPKKGINKILFISKRNLLFDDEIYNNKYNGYGKLYERNILDYILKYEGNFLNGEIYGKGVKFYKNGQKKFEGFFELNNKFNGIYFSPKGNTIYKGEIINDFFYDSEILEIYTIDGDLLYKGKINNNDKKADNYQILKDVILCRNNIKNNYSIDMNLNSTFGQISFISSNHSGRTAIIKRLIENKFYTELNSQLESFYFYKYIYNSVEYFLKIFNLSRAHHQSKNLYKMYIKDDNITLYVVDLSQHYDDWSKIDEEIITYIHENKEKNEKLIYLIIDKIDINKEKKSKLESTRNLAKKLILDGLIYRYFELSAKTKEGFDEFENCLKFDLDLFLKLDQKNKIKTLEENKASDNSLNLSNFNTKLNKWLNF